MSTAAKQLVCALIGFAVGFGLYILISALTGTELDWGNALLVGAVVGLVTFPSAGKIIKRTNG